MAGERDPKQLAALRSSRIKASREMVAKSLHGNWDQDLLFTLKVAFDSDCFNQAKIQECESCYVFGVQTPKRRPVQRERIVLNLDRCRKFVELLERRVDNKSDPLHFRRS